MISGLAKRLYLPNRSIRPRLVGLTVRMDCPSSQMTRIAAKENEDIKEDCGIKFPSLSCNVGLTSIDRALASSAALTVIVAGPLSRDFHFGILKEPCGLRRLLFPSFWQDSSTPAPWCLYQIVTKVNGPLESEPAATPSEPVQCIRPKRRGKMAGVVSCPAPAGRQGSEDPRSENPAATSLGRTGPGAPRARSREWADRLDMSKVQSQGEIVPRGHRGLPRPCCVGRGSAVQFSLLRNRGRSHQRGGESSFSGSHGLSVGGNGKRIVPLRWPEVSALRACGGSSCTT